MDGDFVVKPTPSLFFDGREPGSREMKWGPVKDYGDIVPNERFYVHSRVPPPPLEQRAWRLVIDGDALPRPVTLDFDQLRALPEVTIRRTLDCGANCRSFFPALPARSTGWLPIAFTQWHFGAVGVADWTGVRVKDVLDRAGVQGGVEVMFTGLDAVPTGDADGRVEPYAQVIAMDKVVAADSLLAYRMNREPLPVDHGFPLRAIFSGWGGNTAVKWLGRITVSKQKMGLPTFQSRQVLTGPDIGKPMLGTVGHIRSAMELDEGVTLDPGNLVLRGRAWSGANAISAVDVTLEKLVAPGVWRPVWTPAWRPARLLAKPERLVWARFEIPWDGAEPGRYRVMSRARDESGNVQPRPEDVVWNQQGLGYNGHAPLEIIVGLPTAMP